MLEWNEWIHKASVQKIKGQINGIKLHWKFRGEKSEWREIEECALVPAFISS